MVPSPSPIWAVILLPWARVPQITCYWSCPLHITYSTHLTLPLSCTQVLTAAGIHLRWYELFKNKQAWEVEAPRNSGKQMALTGVRVEGARKRYTVTGVQGEMESWHQLEIQSGCRQAQPLVGQNRVEAKWRRNSILLSQSAWAAMMKSHSLGA